MHSVEWAAHALREGESVAVKGNREIVIVYAVETLSGMRLRSARKAYPSLRLVLTHARARTLKIRLYTPDVVALAVGAKDNAEKLHRVADPTSDMSDPMKGPFEALREKLPSGFSAGIKLAKFAGLLPAIVAVRVAKAEKNIVSIETKDILDFEEQSAKTLKIVTRAQIPLEDAEMTELIAFRSADGGPEHYAILINAPPTSKPVFTRLHSECFTGDFLGSLKCDCGPQLRGAIATISKKGGGILLYLAQEGRGIGLINKLRAYRLQDQGFDTLQANERLGFEADERLYGIAAKMLKLLGYSAVRLLTNNPDKVSSLGKYGIQVVERVPHAFPTNAHNAGYIATKARAGHLF